MTKSKAKMRGRIVKPGADNAPPVLPAAPLVWLVNRLQVDDDNQPLMEGIFSNYNDDIVVEIDSNTLVGRVSPGRGPAERLEIGDGLRVEDGVLIGEGGGEKGDPGPPGPVGPVGPQGPAGASSSMWLYRFDSGTTYSDPGAGRYKMNQSAPSTVTKLYVDRLTQDGLDPTNVFTLATFDDEFIIQRRGLAANYQKWRLLGPAVIIGGDWFEVPVAFVSQAGGAFNNNQEVTFLLRTKGEPGPVGPQGPQGVQGNTGPQGSTGPQGPVGGTGPVGPKGNTGDTGPQGPQGIVGPQGGVGPQGPQGFVGATGAKGDKGDQGDIGPRGETGPQGPQGETGETGPAGDFGDNEAPTDGQTYGRKDGAWSLIEGSAVYVGDGPPVGAAINSLWWESDTGLLWLNFNDGSSTQWVLVGGGSGLGSVGPQGPEGPAGPQGVQGPTGSQGPTGPTGSQGPIGPTGAQGADGAPGAPGATGAAGTTTVTVADTPPPGAVDGTMWWESDTGQLYVRYNDGSSTQWVIAAPQPDFSALATKTEVAAQFQALAANGMQINGGMHVAQERTSLPGITNGAWYIVDNWQASTSGPHVITVAQNGTVPPGFSTSLATFVTTENASPAAAEYCVIQQLIEGVRVARLGWGTASAMPITLAFWIYAARPGNYSGVILNGVGDRSYPFVITVNAASTWEYKTITIPGCVDGVWDPNDGVGMQVIFAMMCGSDYQAPANVWKAGSLALGVTGTINGVAATSDFMLLTGVVVLPGVHTIAAAQSPLLMRPYDQELTACQRYWQQAPVCFDYSSQSGFCACAVTYSVTMRIPPAVSFIPAIAEGSTAINSIYTWEWGLTAQLYGWANARVYWFGHAVLNARL